MAHVLERFKEFLDRGDPDQIFVLEEEIASGSFGAVYRVRYIFLQKFQQVERSDRIGDSNRFHKKLAARIKHIREDPK
jgi:hypothetical protein